MKIGNLDLEGNVFLAPMAGITDTPFRRVVQEFGVSALWTEMISANGVAIAWSAFRTMELAGHTVPTVFQISGKNPGVMAEAARTVQERGAAAVDVNMGCPVRKVVSKGSGAALMKDPVLAGRIVRAVRRAVTIPVTVKIRSGWDDGLQNAPELAGIIESEGADALTIHSRSRSNGHSGPPSLEIIRQVKESVRIPVIGNGGIAEVTDAVGMIEKTGCDGVMIGRGALGRPWIPGRILSRLSGGPLHCGGAITFAEVIREHFQYMLEWWGTIGAVRRMRKHLAWYSKGFAGGCEFRHTVFRLDDPEPVLDHVQKFFGKVAI
ncbi:MAG TPA: tRNA dihydrouridine synthase DusB [Desulfomonilaceae bacterium]|nr:tRNA dihydrouridine synthase DusB [Desulfomonilaceae bacterium]